ncbi:MAG: hypothetical protein O7D34_10220 [Ignavibacteria bacterium]|nr:hypothetical protein [Ignavibacteria bacterium]
MHKLTFYPLGNADCCLVDLHNKKKILWDYANKRDPDDDEDKRCDLPKLLRDDLEAAKRDYYDVVTFTHADDDHIHGFSEFFYLEHAEKYQDDDRIKINDLWVPAAVILETGLSGEARILRSEARYRLKNGERIRVFSKPEALKDWLEGEGLSLEERQHLITSAGKTVPTFKKDKDGVEFFVHAPFSETIDDQEIDRNDAAIVVQATFLYNGCESKLILGADSKHEIWSEIVNITKYYGRELRLEWDVFNISHHCSYTALSSEKGKTKTTPVPEVDWLFMKKGNKHCKLVSTSWSIPSKDTTQPPHRQAKNYYRDVESEHEGEFVVTMEHPSKTAPELLVITLDCSGATVKKTRIGAASVISSRPSPRVG